MPKPVRTHVNRHGWGRIVAGALILMVAFAVVRGPAEARPVVAGVAYTPTPLQPTPMPEPSFEATEGERGPGSWLRVGEEVEDETLRSLFNEMGDKHDFPPRILASWMWYESEYQDKPGTVGEVGPAQFIPSTWAGLMKETGKGWPLSYAHQHKYAIEAMAMYMSQIRGQMWESGMSDYQLLKLTLMGYNQGPNLVKRNRGATYPSKNLGKVENCLRYAGFRP